jgi:DNA helicase-2/ATP-dependent DNA helicase PcrA
MAESWTDQLNDAQRQAATHPGGPLLVIAGAGTGKTKTLAARVAHLLDQGVTPERILLLTFTRRAAAEMTKRAGELSDPAAAGRVWGGTFHGIANRLLRRHAPALGLSPDFTILDQGDAADAINLVRGRLDLGSKKQRFPRKDTLLAIYSRTVNSRVKLEKVLERDYPWCAEHQAAIAEVFKKYTQQKRQQQLLDYDDLLLYWHALMHDDKLGPRVAEDFDHVLVDEYQDTNTLQAEILRALRTKNDNVMVVGDDAQAIYSFRAATVDNILSFPDQFPGTTVIKLEENYRSTQPILDAANAVIEQASKQYDKQLYSRDTAGETPALIASRDEPDQCQAVCDRVLEDLEAGTPLMRQAVLFRTGHHSDQLEVELTRRNIPFVKYGGLRFIETAHVKDMLAMLRLLENPVDELSWYRLLQLLEGVGPATARKLIDALKQGAANVDASDKELATPLYNLLHHPPNVPAAAAEQFNDLRHAMADCLGVQVTGNLLGDHQNNGKPGQGVWNPATEIERLGHFYEPVCERCYDHAPARLQDIEQLQQIATGYRSRSSFLTDLTLDPPSSSQELAGAPLLEEDYLILSTIHSAKGGEWDHVHIIHAADGNIPSEMATGDEDAIEEERRLLYVAMTRARRSLCIHFPQRYYYRGPRRSDRHSYAQRSRFLIGRASRCLTHQGGNGNIGEPTATKFVEHPGRDAHRQVDAMLGELWGGA